MGINPDTLVIHIPAGETPSYDGHWSMSRFDPFASNQVREDYVEMWDGLDSNPVRVPNGEVIFFMQQMMKKYG